jgi:hypothetical protein
MADCLNTVMNLQLPWKMGHFLTSLASMTFFKDSFAFRWLSVAVGFIVFIYFYSYIFCFVFPF